MVTSFNLLNASTLLTQSPVAKFSLIESTGCIFCLFLNIGDFIVTSVDFENFDKGDSASFFDKVSFSVLKSDVGRNFLRNLSKSWSLCKYYRIFDKKFKADLAFERTSAEASRVKFDKTCIIFSKSLLLRMSEWRVSKIFRKQRAALALICEEREEFMHWNRTLTTFVSDT